MEETLIIPKARTLPQSEDYQFLRQEGFKYIENLAHKLWTDYNEHDSGITIIEAVSFALTELGYRTGFDIKDLMAAQDGTINTNQSFFTVREIFTCNPVTVEDYRKLLVDLLGVHNAWLFPKANVGVLEASDIIPKTEVLLYPHCKKDALVYNNTDHTPIDIRGLYDVMLDLDNSDEFGDLNSGNIIYTLPNPDLQGLQIEAILGKWNEVDFELLGKIQDQTPTTIDVKDDSGKWKITLTYLVSGSPKDFIYYAIIALRQPVSDLEAKVKAELNDNFNQEAIIEIYFRKIQKVMEIIKSAQKRLHANRNLCEDFKNIDTVIPVEIGFCADIEAAPESDLEQVLAEVYFLIEEYFNPDVKFYSLKEMLEKNIPTEEIFEGPRLEHGFIDTEELINTQLRSEIRVSDIINLIMDIEGVLSVKNVLLTEYDKYGKAKLPSQKWCLHLPPYHKPVLNINRSKVLFFKDNLPFKANAEEARDILSILRGANERGKLKGHDQDLPMPKGSFYQLDEYLTVQYEFPQTYGISQFGLPSTVPDERKAKALQLRAYMMFFDQLLANFFSQLHHAKDLFSTDPKVKQTYFAQYLSDIKDIDKVYLNASTLEKVLEGPIAGETAAITKERFELLEFSEANFYQRRNKFLDHLLARFAESFNEYVLMLYTAEGDKKKKKSQDKLIEDKINFIKDYPTISYERGKAFDYLSPAWNTNNVSGLEKRLARLTGIKDYSRRDLFCFPFPIQIIPSGTKYTFSVEETPAKTYLTSLKEYDTLEEIDLIINKVYDSIYRKERYSIDNTNPAKLHVVLKDAYDVEIASSVKYFTKEETATKFINDVSEKFKPMCDPEGIFLIEHLLLRPHFPVTVTPPETKEEKYKLMKVCLEKDCAFCGEEDSYSFRISVIMPYWPERFRDINFRTFFEKTVHTETPAHIAAKVCWVNYTTMQQLQEIHKEWLATLKDYAEDLIKNDEAKKDKFREANNKLVTLLGKMHSEYPEARLHDCETGVTNPVRLGSTVLGTF